MGLFQRPELRINQTSLPDQFVSETPPLAMFSPWRIPVLAAAFYDHGINNCRRYRSRASNP